MPVLFPAELADLRGTIGEDPLYPRHPCAIKKQYYTN